MTSILLSSDAIQCHHCGQFRFNGCADIIYIHAVCSADGNTDDIEARIPATTTRTPYYEIKVGVRRDGSAVLWAFCTCPIGHRCKHIHKVLVRISHSYLYPIPGPDLEHQTREARRRFLSYQKSQGAAVYVAFACKSEQDSGSDFRRSFFIKESFEQKTLGVFFDIGQANECARSYVEEDLGVDLSDEDGDDDEEFAYDSSDTGVFDDHGYLDKVWVEHRAIEDASHDFHP